MSESLPMEASPEPCDSPKVSSVGSPAGTSQPIIDADEDEGSTRFPTVVVSTRLSGSRRVEPLQTSLPSSNRANPSRGSFFARAVSCVFSCSCCRKRRRVADGTSPADGREGISPGDDNIPLLVSPEDKPSVAGPVGCCCRTWRIFKRKCMPGTDCAMLVFAYAAYCVSGISLTLLLKFILTRTKSAAASSARHPLGLLCCNFLVTLYLGMLVHSCIRCWWIKPPRRRRRRRTSSVGPTVLVAVPVEPGSLQGVTVELAEVQIEGSPPDTREDPAAEEVLVGPEKDTPSQSPIVIVAETQEVDSKDDVDVVEVVPEPEAEVEVGPSGLGSAAAVGSPEVQSPIDDPDGSSTTSAPALESTTTPKEVEEGPLMCSTFVSFRMVLLGALLGLDYAFSNISYKFIAITYYAIVKSLVPMVVLIISWVRQCWIDRQVASGRRAARTGKRQRFGALVVFAVLCVCAGIAVASVSRIIAANSEGLEDLSGVGNNVTVPAAQESEEDESIPGWMSELIGFGLVFLSCLFQSSRMVLAQVMMEPTSDNGPEEEQQPADATAVVEANEGRSAEVTPKAHTGLEVALYTSPTAAVVVFFMALLTEFGFLIEDIQLSSSKDDTQVWYAYLVGSWGCLSLLAFCLILATYALVRRTSGLTLAVTGQGRGILLIALSTLIFGDPWTLWTVVGFSLTFVGVVLYQLRGVLHKKKSDVTPKREPPGANAAASTTTTS